MIGKLCKILLLSFLSMVHGQSYSSCEEWFSRSELIPVGEGNRGDSTSAVLSWLNRVLSLKTDPHRKLRVLAQLKGRWVSGVYNELKKGKAREVGIEGIVVDVFLGTESDIESYIITVKNKYGSDKEFEVSSQGRSYFKRFSLIEPKVRLDFTSLQQRKLSRGDVEIDILEWLNKVFSKGDSIYGRINSLSQLNGHHLSGVHFDRGTHKTTPFSGYALGVSHNSYDKQGFFRLILFSDFDGKEQILEFDMDHKIFPDVVVHLSKKY